MDHQTPSARAEVFCARMVKLFPATKTLATPVKLFKTFFRTAANPKLMGRTLASIPEGNQVVQADGNVRNFLFHVIWFEEEGYEDAFCAVIYLPDTGEYGFLTNEDPEWHAWLDNYARRAAAMARFGGALDIPPPSKLH